MSSVALTKHEKRQKTNLGDCHCMLERLSFELGGGFAPRPGFPSHSS